MAIFAPALQWSVNIALGMTRGNIWLYCKYQVNTCGLPSVIPSIPLSLWSSESSLGSSLGGHPPVGQKGAMTLSLLQELILSSINSTSLFKDWWPINIANKNVHTSSEWIWMNSVTPVEDIFLPNVSLGKVFLGVLVCNPSGNSYVALENGTPASKMPPGLFELAEVTHRCLHRHLLLCCKNYNKLRWISHLVYGSINSKGKGIDMDMAVPNLITRTNWNRSRKNVGALPCWLENDSPYKRTIVPYACTQYTEKLDTYTMYYYIKNLHGSILH